MNTFKEKKLNSTTESINRETLLYLEAYSDFWDEQKRDQEWINFLQERKPSKRTIKPMLISEFESIHGKTFAPSEW